MGIDSQLPKIWQLTNVPELLDLRRDANTVGNFWNHHQLFQ